MRIPSKPVRAVRLTVSAVVLAASFVLLGQGEANAVSSTCRETARTFDIPGNDPDRKVTVRLCTDRSTSGASVRGCGKVTFLSVLNGFKWFDYFHLRMDVRKQPDGTRVAGSSWDITDESNAGSSYQTGWMCTAWAHVGATAPRVYYNTATVTYDIDEDGKGRFTWGINPTSVI